MSATWNGKWHPLAERLPLRDESEIRELADGIRENGQHVPCQMTPDGEGLDGRNRLSMADPTKTSRAERG